MKITKRQREVLQRLYDGEELTYSSGEWWLENDRISSRTAKFLLTYCLVRKMDLGSDNYEVYEGTSEIQDVLECKDYEPLVVRALKALKGKP